MDGRKSFTDIIIGVLGSANSAEINVRPMVGFNYVNERCVQTDGLQAQNAQFDVLCGIPKILRLPGRPCQAATCISKSSKISQSEKSLRKTMMMSHRMFSALVILRWCWEKSTS